MTRVPTAISPDAIAHDMHMIACKIRDRLRMHGFSPIGTVVEIPADAWDHFFPDQRQVFLHDIKFRRGHGR